MKQKTTLPVLLILLGLFVLPMMHVNAQTNVTASKTELTVKGTSTLHDWHMTSTKAQVKGTLQWEGAKLVGVQALQLNLIANTLKSDNNGLDKNAYKALMTDKHSQIQFVLSQATITPTGANTYKIVGTGQLSIAGTTKKTTLNATATVHPGDKNLHIKGTTTFNMSNYGVKPPTVMMGTIKTGDTITITYETTLQSN